MTSYLEVIKEIAGRDTLRIEQWKDEYKHWRVGVNWFDKDRYDYIVEKPTLEECLENVLDFYKSKETK